MHCEQDGWHIDLGDSARAANSPCLNELKQLENNAYLLPVNDANNEDRVAIAVNFIQELFAE